MMRFSASTSAREKRWVRKKTSRFFGGPVGSRKKDMVLSI
jgi:hypothetical protein